MFLVNVAGRIFAINQTFLSHSLLRDTGGNVMKRRKLYEKSKSTRCDSACFRSRSLWLYL